MIDYFWLGNPSLLGNRKPKVADKGTLREQLLQNYVKTNNRNGTFWLFIVLLLDIY